MLSCVSVPLSDDGRRSNDTSRTLLAHPPNPCMITCTLSLEAEHERRARMCSVPRRAHHLLFMYSNAYAYAHALVEAHEQLRAVPSGRNARRGRGLALFSGSRARAAGRPTTTTTSVRLDFWFPSARTASVAAAGTGHRGTHDCTNSLGSSSPAPLVPPAGRARANSVAPRAVLDAIDLRASPSQNAPRNSPTSAAPRI